MKTDFMIFKLINAIVYINDLMKTIVSKIQLNDIVFYDIKDSKSNPQTR